MILKRRTSPIQGNSHTAPPPEWVRYYAGIVRPLWLQRSRISNNAAQALASFLSENRWDFSPTSDGPRTTWLSVLIEFLSIHGFFPGWLMSGMSTSILISRFRSRFVKLCKANSISLIPASHMVEARKLEHDYPHALKVKYKGS